LTDDATSIFFLDMSSCLANNKYTELAKLMAGRAAAEYPELLPALPCASCQKSYISIKLIPSAPDTLLNSPGESNTYRRKSHPGSLLDSTIKQD
jgi:hypothetical protein